MGRMEFVLFTDVSPRCVPCCFEDAVRSDVHQVALLSYVCCGVHGFRVLSCIQDWRCNVRRCAENFRQLCTGESGTVPMDDKQREGAGKARHFKVTSLQSPGSALQHISCTAS